MSIVEVDFMLCLLEETPTIELFCFNMDIHVHFYPQFKTSMAQKFL